MPFRKLWNSLTGRGNEPAPLVSVPTSTIVLKTPAKPPEVPARNNVLSMGSRKQPDDLGSLIIRSLKDGQGQRRILEIGVGDGSRTATLLSELSRAGFDSQTLSYIVIDLFELGGSQVTLRDFHRRLRGVTPRPSIVPEPLGIALVRILHTYGLVDLIMIDPSINESDIAENAVIFAKVQRPAALVLRQSNGRWSSTTNEKRRAA